MFKKYRTLVVLSFLMILLIGVTACGKSQSQEQETEQEEQQAERSVDAFSDSVLLIWSDGSVTEKIVESFAQEYYSLEDLTTYVEEQVAAYQDDTDSGDEETDERISVDEISEDEEAQTATVILTYLSAEDFAAFNNTDFYIVEAQALTADADTGSDADADYELVLKEAASLMLTDTAGTQAGTAGDLEDLESYTAVLTYTTEQVSVPGEILYVSSGSSITEEGTVIGDGSLLVILYEES